MLLVHEHGDKSFPSGHTIASFEAAVVLLYYSKKMGIPAMILAVLVSVSRLYIFVHYPTDVIASIVLGTLFGIIGYWLAGKLQFRNPFAKGKFQAK
jgi:undecaprenyl-diphosphatase